MSSAARAAAPVAPQPTPAGGASPSTQPAPGAAADGEAGAGWVVAALFAFALVLGAYFSFRFGGRWSEADTATIADTIRAMVRDQTLLSPSGSIYSNGYAFGAVTTFVLAFTGLDLPTLMQSVYPLVSASLALVAWPLYRELTGSTRGATLATLLMFAQPELVFVILRGSHERILRVLLLISLFLLIRSFRFSDRPRSYAAYVSLFYLTVYGVIATNSFFGSSYIGALAITLVGSWFGGFFGPNLAWVSQATRQRLIYVPVFCLVLVFLFNSYIYPPAGAVTSQVPDILDRLSRLLLTTSPESGPSAVTSYDPYAAVVDQWIDVKVYFLLSTGTFFLMIASAIVWLRTGLRWLAGGAHRPTLGQWLLWLFYAAFALQGGLSIVADRAGALGGNLQHRTFPSFVMVAAPMVALYFVDWRPGRRTRMLGAFGLGLLAVLAIVKATNEPAVSNKWTFYLPAEVAAMEFAGQHVEQSEYWSEFDERLRTVQSLLGSSAEARPYGGQIDPSTRNFLVTDVARLRSARLNRPLPPVLGELRVYDNGAGQMYHIRARSPYQD
ncbi:MAG TPA: hypothetical protein VG370_09840 [Chloroflexota bacterium]|jgi:hypothetical protein|nr:hypothetical protein [Chloroflexota bacterium]